MVITKKSSMLISCFVVCMVSVGIMILDMGVASGQNYPNKTVRIVTAAAGSGADFAARQIAQELAVSLGQQVVVENRGGSGIVTAQTVAKAPADGYTLLFFGSTIWLFPFLQDNVPYDPVRDFLPITLVTRSPYILVVHPSVPANSVKQLVALAKARPGELNYASPGSGSTPHLAGALFTYLAGVNIVHIPYKGAGPGLIGLSGGEVDLMFATASSAMALVRSGRLRGLAATSAEPSPLLPGLPTVAAFLPDYEAVSLQGLFAPARTPLTIINRLNQEIVRALNQADVKERFFKAGTEVVGSSPEQFAATIKLDMAKMGKVIKDAGIRTD